MAYYVILSKLTDEGRKKCKAGQCRRQKNRKKAVKNSEKKERRWKNTELDI
jgi:uncharacterized protein with GYD domain